MIRDVSCGACLPVQLVRYAAMPKGTTYVWQSTVCAPADLWLVDVDEDLGMSQGPSTAVTGDCPAIHPSNWLLVYQLNRSVRSWLDLLVHPLVT